VRKLVILISLLLIAISLKAGVIELTSSDALFDAVSDTSIVDTVLIENDKWDTPYICIGYHSYGQTLSNDTAPIFNIEIVPSFTSLLDSLQTGPAVTLGVDTITKNANCDETTWHSLSDYYPANQRFIIRVICAEIDVSDTDSIGARAYLAKPEKR